MPVHRQHLVEPAEPSAMVLMPPEALSTDAGAPTTQTPSGPATTTVRIPKGLRPALVAVEGTAPQSQSPLPKTLDSRPFDPPGSAAGRQPGAGLSTDRTGATSEKSVPAPRRAETGDYSVLEATKLVSMPPRSRPYAEPRESPQPAGGEKLPPTPVVRPTLKSEDGGRVHTEPSPRHDFQAPQAVPPHPQRRRDWRESLCDPSPGKRGSPLAESTSRFITSRLLHRPHRPHHQHRPDRGMFWNNAIWTDLD